MDVAVCMMRSIDDIKSLEQRYWDPWWLERRAYRSKRPLHWKWCSNLGLSMDNACLQRRSFGIFIVMPPFSMLDMYTRSL